MLGFIGLFMEVDISLKKLKDRRNMKSVPVENSDYFHAIASLVEVGHLRNSPKINENIIRCIFFQSQFEYIEIIMKSIDYLYL